MTVVDIKLFKQHVRADDFEDDDAYLAQLLVSAQESVIRATNRTEQELTEIGGGQFPAPLKQAIMMLAGHWYNQREAVSQGQMFEVPYTLQSLIKPYRKLSSR